MPDCIELAPESPHHMVVVVVCIYLSGGGFRAGHRITCLPTDPLASICLSMSTTQGRFWVKVVWHFRAGHNLFTWWYTISQVTLGVISSTCTVQGVGLCREVEVCPHPPLPRAHSPPHGRPEYSSVLSDALGHSYTYPATFPRPFEE